MPYLSIENLSVSYGGTRVLDRVSLGVERGEMIALLGSSGCGKTTLLRAIAGFVMPDEGAIKVDGRDIAHLPPEKRETAMMFQSYALWPHMTVAGNIGYGLRMRGWKSDAIGQRKRLFAVVRDVDRRDADTPLQRAQLVAQLEAHLVIEIRHRLVEQQ